MSAGVPNGGPAFPIPGLQHDCEFNGASLRDYFAAKAIQGMLAGGCTLDINGELLAIGRAKTAYAIADAMLAARAK